MSSSIGDGRVADRIVVVAEGMIVADGTGAQIKSRVAGRTISPDDDVASPSELVGLPAAVDVEHVGSRLQVHTTDSDTTLRALLDRYPSAHDIEIASAKLEDAFLALTTE